MFVTLLKCLSDSIECSYIIGTDVLLLKKEKSNDVLQSFGLTEKHYSQKYLK